MAIDEFDGALAELGWKVSEFCRSYLNQWKKKPKAGDETALGNWNGCRVDPPDEPPIPDAFGVAFGDADDLHRRFLEIGQQPGRAAFGRHPVEQEILVSAAVVEEEDHRAVGRPEMLADGALGFLRQHAGVGGVCGGRDPDVEHAV